MTSGKAITVQYVKKVYKLIVNSALFPPPKLVSRQIFIIAAPGM